MTYKKTLAIFGIPITPLSTEETAKQILHIQKASTAPQYITTLNSDFLANTFSFPLGNIRQPELHKIFIHSPLVTADGMPLVWLSYLLGNPLPERVTGADLFPALLKKLNDEKGSLFLFGGDEKINQEAVKKITKEFPKISIVGTASPLIFIQGKGLEESLDRDLVLTEEIVKHPPNLLFISLGHPKQEIWFERVQQYLPSITAIGIGGTLNFFTGKVSRAPNWMQHFGLEWFHRFLQEPYRLLWRYAYDFIHLTTLSLPLLLMHSVSRLLSSGSREITFPLLFQSDTESIGVITLPEILDQQNAPLFYDHLMEIESQQTLIADFSSLKHFDLEGLGLLITFWHQIEQAKKPLISFGMSKKIAQLLRFHKAFQLLCRHHCDTAACVAKRLYNWNCGEPFYDALEQHDDHLKLYFFGQLNHSIDFTSYFEKLLPILKYKHCVLDLRYIHVIDNTGFCFLSKLKNFFKRNNKTFTIKNIPATLSKQFKLVKFDENT